MPRTRGFTLIELMIAVAIIAILAAIAIPSYAEYVRRGRITEAVAGLSGMRTKMEQYFQDNRTYVGACPPFGTANIAALPANGNFIYACPTLTGSAYTITATGATGNSMEGYQYTLDQNNTRATVMTSPSTWPSNAACWVLKKDGSC